MTTLAWLLWTCTAAFAQTQDYAVGAGDVINVTVHGHDFGRKAFVVGANGEISFPYVGHIDVADKSVFEIEQVIETALADGYLVDPQITVHVEDYRSKRVEVLGAVGKPGVYSLRGPTTVRALLAQAGGFKAENGGAVVLSRGEETHRFGPTELDGPEGSFQVVAGDVLNVDPGGSVVYVGGSISKPGPVRYTDGLTLSQAVLRAGGNSNLGRLSGTYVLRGDERITINLKRVMKGKDADFLLLPGDKVIIPESPI